MIIDFYKYQGTGNDFIIIDDREVFFDLLDKKLISSLCNRKTGIGADGLIILRNHSDYDFEMIYFNSDGSESTMCGNGGRCIIDFANMINIIGDTTRFLAVDGEHEGKILKDTVTIKMQDVNVVKKQGDDFILDTGSPHYVKIVDNVTDVNVNDLGKKIRDKYKEGINVNFIEFDKEVNIRTYERGVESETLSCGTGVIASAIALNYSNQIAENNICVNTQGGQLIVSFDKIDGKYSNIWLTGAASMVFSGEFSC